MERDLFHLLVRSSHVCNGQGWTSSKSTAQTCLGHVRMQGPKHLSHHCCLPGCASVGCWGRCRSEPQSQALPPGMQVSQEGACPPHHSVCALPCCYWPEFESSPARSRLGTTGRKSPLSMHTWQGPPLCQASSYPHLASGTRGLLLPFHR